MSSPLQYPCTPKRPTAPRNAYHPETPSPTYNQRSRVRSYTGSSPLNDKTPVQVTRRVSKSNSLVFADLGGNVPQRAEDPIKSMMRQKFRARCLERAAKAREEQVRRRRYSSGYPSSEPSSDGFDEAMDEDDEENEDAVVQDELFRRIVESSFRRSQHSYRVSYALEVGSSFDPDLEDVSKWEEELGCDTSSGLLHSEDMPPPEFDEDELVAYAEDLAAIAGLEDIPEEDLFGWSGFKDGDGATASAASFSGQGHAQVENDDDMCIN
ncbi:hypothetical protein F5887DRAFT_966905 [Amanita rubescens]|nr:hypothetical protein F5887DRAFT_966905 [Amanita rubescens]